MKLHLPASILILALAPCMYSQTTTTTPIDTAPASSTDWGARAGDREITFGGVGGSNTDFDSSFGGVNGSYGVFLSDMLEISLRQSINYSNPDNGDSAWNGATRVAADWHFLPGGSNFRPFVGVNFGGAYGEGVQDTFAAGIEAGAKFYVRPKTFVFATLEYGWFFNKADQADNAFSDGQYIWSAGVGFNF